MGGGRDRETKRRWQRENEMDHWSDDDGEKRGEREERRKAVCP